MRKHIPTILIIIGFTPIFLLILYSLSYGLSPEGAGVPFFGSDEHIYGRDAFLFVFLIYASHYAKILIPCFAISMVGILQIIIGKKFSDKEGKNDKK